MRRGERGVPELLGVEVLRVRVRVLARDKPDVALDELQEEIVLGPVLSALEFAFGEVRAVDREVDVDEDGDAGGGLGREDG